MYAYVFVFNTNTFCVYRWMLNEWHTSLEDQNDTRKKKKRRSTFLTLKINEEEKLNSDYKSLNVIVILTSLLFIIFKKKCFIHPFFFLFTFDPIFSFLGHNKHSILYSYKIERCSNGNSISKLRHLYKRYIMHIHE
jgi:hypothetical protein